MVTVTAFELLVTVFWTVPARVIVYLYVAPAGPLSVNPVVRNENASESVPFGMHRQVPETPVGVSIRSVPTSSAAVRVPLKVALATAGTTIRQSATRTTDSRAAA